MSGIQDISHAADFATSGIAVPQAAIGRDDTVTMRDFVLFLLRSRWFALIGAAICAIAAAAAAWIVTPQYTATVVLLPISGRGGLGSSLGPAVSQLSGLASLAGLNIGGMGAQKAEALATLQSGILTDRYVSENDLLPILFSKQWNATTRTWRSRDPRKQPTLWDANQLFKKIRLIADNSKTGVVTFSIRWKNADLAAAWANGLVKMTNDYLRQRAINQSERSISYLNREVAKTNILEVKNAIYGLMESEIKNEMVAKGRRDYALRVIDPAVPPQRKTFPKPMLWIIAGAVAGCALGLLVAILRETMIDEGAAGRSSPSAPHRRT